MSKILPKQLLKFRLIGGLPEGEGPVGVASFEAGFIPDKPGEFTV